MACKCSDNGQCDECAEREYHEQCEREYYEKLQQEEQMTKKFLDIDINGWIDIACDKCGTISSYHPSHPANKCFGCMPVTTPEGFDRMAAEGKIR